MLLNSILVDAFYVNQTKLNEYNLSKRQVPLLVGDNLIVSFYFNLTNFLINKLFFDDILLRL